MKSAPPTPTPKYHSPLREAQAQATRERIAQAVLALFQRQGGQEDITFKGVAKEAGVTEMTVYRHFPTREDLMQVLWERVNSQLGVGMPESVEALFHHNEELYQAYENIAPLMLASLTTKQGREMRLSLKARRQAAFLKLAEEVNPKLAPAEKKRVAAILQLLQSSHAWDSMRSNWDMTPKEIADTTRLAIEAVLAASRKKEKP